MNPPLIKKIPFLRRRYARQWANTTKMLIDSHEHREQHLIDTAENANRNALFQSTTIWHLQRLIDQLRTENVRLSHEAERANDSGFITLNLDEAKLTKAILSWYLEGIEDDEPYYNEQARIRFFLDRLQSSLSGG